MRAWHWAAAALAAAALAATPLAAQTTSRPRARLEQLLRQRVGLNDRQLQQLQRTNRALAPERRTLALRERAIADSLSAQIADGTPSDPVVSGLITRLFVVRRARLALREREQREWANYLTPTQRAMLLGVQERAQRGGEALQGARRRRAAP